MRIFKKIFVFSFILICAFIFNINNAFALDIKIEDVKITEKSDNVVTSDIEFNDNSTTTNIEFKELNDFVTYKLTLKNNDNKKYNIEDIIDDNDNENIKVTYKYDDKEINAKDTQDIYVTLKYDKKLINKKQITLSDLTITLNLEDEAGNKVIANINPKTGDNIISFIVLFVVALLILLFSVILIKRRKGKGLLLLLLLIPCVIMAKVQLKFNIKFTTIKVDGEMLPYTVSVKDSDGNITDRTVVYGEPVGELPQPSKDGYTFDKYIDQDGNEVDKDTIVESDMTITPKFNVIEYNITYDLNGGSVTNPDKYTVKDEITLNNPEKTGYTFSGWTGSNGNDLQTRVTIVNSTGDLNYVANYSANQDTNYTVIHRYPKLDGTYEEYTENLHGATDTKVKPALQEKEGFTGPELEEITINGDGTSTLTYTYTRNNYNFSITDRTYVDSISTSNGTYPHGTEITVKAQEREGYTFKWSDDNTDYERTFELKGDKTLTPIYTPNTNTPYKVIHKYEKLDGTYEEVTNDLEGTTDEEVTPSVVGKEGFNSPTPQTITISGDGTSTLTYTYTRKTYNFTITDRTYLNSTSTSNGTYPYESEITIKAQEREGYTFKWSDDNTDYERTFELKGDKTLTPIYTPNTNTPYKVIHKYEKLDGTYEEVTNDLEGTTDEEVTPSVIDKEGFNSPTTQTITISGDGNTTVTYTYTRINYSFSITDRTNVDSTSTNNGTYPYGTTITVKAQEREGYTFKWSDDNTDYERTFELTSDTTLTPIYTQLEYTVSFNTNGGSEISSQTVNAGNKAIKPNDPTKTEFRFIDWYTEDTFENVFDFDTEIYENKTLYAKWVHPVVYFQLPPDWYGSTVNAYLFNSSSGSGMTWPGNSMNLVDSEKQIYSYALSDEQISSYDRIVFTNGESVDSGSNLNKNARQTMDVTISNEMYEKIFVPELYSGEGTRVLFRNASKNWVQHIYKWNSSNSSENNGWPGHEFTDSINSSTYYTIVESKYNKMIFNKGTGGSGNQTNDLNVPTNQDMVYNINNSGPYRIFYFGGWKDYTEWNDTGYNDWTSDTGDYIKFVNSNPNYRVTFNPNGGRVSPTSIDVTKGSTIGTLPTPTAPTNKLFDGWYTDLSDGVKVDSSYTPNGNITLYAKYTDCSDFANDSWATIVANVKENQEYYPVGCTKEVRMPSFYIKPSRPLLLRVANNTTPEECSSEGYSQTACGFVLEFANTVSFVVMNDTDTNVGGWRDSSARNYINTTIYNDLPTELKNAIIDTTVVSGYGSSDSSNFTTTDKLYLLSSKEVFGSNIAYDTSSTLTRQLDYYNKMGVTTSNYSKASKSYYATNNGSGWWFRSASNSGTSSFGCVSHMGQSTFSVATDSNNHSVSPAFRIG